MGTGSGTSLFDGGCVAWQLCTMIPGNEAGACIAGIGIAHDAVVKTNPGERCYKSSFGGVLGCACQIQATGLPSQASQS